MKQFVIGLLGFACLALSAYGQDNFDEFKDPPKTPESRPSANIALGASYTLQPAADYSHCTDPDDKTQLTDGVYSEGYFWVAKTTVGWKRANPAIVTLDLGEVRPIRGASFHTAAGTAGVAWPTSIKMLVAGEDKQFVEVGDLVGLGMKHGVPQQEGYATHRFWTDELRTHGRYAAFVFVAQPYAFVDEIEVYEGEDEWVNEPLQGERIADIKKNYVVSLQEGAIQRRILWDISAIREETGKSNIGDAAKQAILDELAALEQEAHTPPDPSGEDFEAILPLNNVHTGVFCQQARLWDAMGLEPITVWQSRLWDRLLHVDTPTTEGVATVGVAMMLNEFRASAFNVSNAAQEPVTLEVRITGLPGGVNPDYVTVHEVVWTGTKSGIPVAAALPEAKRVGDAYAITALPGLTRQVWLTFHPEKVEPGTHKGVIEVNGPRGTHNVPLTLKVYDVRFPDQPTLYFGGWDYTNGNGHRGVNLENMEALIKHMREHFVDSPWATNAVMPQGAYDDEGRLTTEPDTTAFDEWFARWRDARQYLVFSNVPGHLGQFEMGSAQFDVAVGEWTKFWARYMKKLGKQPEQLGLLLVDEPHAPEQDARILAWAKAIRAADTGIRIWEDPIYRGDMTKANQEMIANCHVLCPNRPIFIHGPQSYRDYYVDRRNEGIALEFYSCSGPVRSLDPYAYHRLQAWECWKYEAQGTYFWAFGDTGYGSSWNEYAARGTDYCPQFLGPKSVTAGKHLESAREGVEDFEYLVMLRDAIADAEQEGRQSEALKQAKKLLSELPEQVLEAGYTKSLFWNEPIDRNLADKARLQVLDALVALRKGE